MKKSISIIILIFVLAFDAELAAAQDLSTSNWQDISSVEDVYEAFPQQFEQIFLSLNLEAPELKKVKNAYEKDKYVKAGKLLLKYYENSNTATFLRKDLPAETTKTTPLGDSLQQNLLTFYGQSAKIPLTPTGQIDWTFSGPSDDIEWAWGLNRHHHFTWLLDTYFETGNPAYVKQIDRNLKDWIISSYPYPGEKSRTELWRGLEVSFRVKVWANIFYNLIESEYLSPATRLLMMSSLPDHAHYLRNFHAQGNWLTMEMSGLATVAIAWPEYESSNAWLAYTKETMTESMKEQLYPDGVQTELTSHYHRVALSNFNLYYQLCQQAKEELPDYYTRQLEAMWEYLATTIRPTGYGVLNNDSDKTYNREMVVEAARQYNRDDWMYIATNGQEGTRPEGSPSKIYTWPGQLVMRSGYETDAHWAFFDLGPWGSGHQHNDKLHLSITAYGRDLLVDGGRFAYRGEIAQKFRGYALGSFSHNTLLLDGNSQDAGPRVASEPVGENHYQITKEYDYAWHSFDEYRNLEGVGKHTRTLFYLRDKFWIVIDQVDTDRPRKVEALWHWHPESKIVTNSRNVVATDHEHGNLQVIPLGETTWQLDLVKGREEPTPQGWYSEEYNQFEPNTASIFSTNIDQSDVFVWLLYPSEEKNAKAQAEIERKDNRALTIKVQLENQESWELTIPYENPEGVMVKKGE